MDEDAVTEMKELMNMKQKKSSHGSRIASDKSQFLGCAQVLELIPIGRSKLYLMIAAGEFPAQKKLGTRVAVWSKKEVEAWIAEKMAIQGGLNKMDEIENIEFREKIKEAAEGIESGDPLKDFLTKEEINQAITELAKIYEMES